MTQINQATQPPKHISGMLLSLLSDLSNALDEQAERDRLFQIIRANDWRKWGAIRELYAKTDTSVYTPYPIDWTLIFTPIESMAWGEIRYLGLPFWPQFPIGKYFADFANPIKKIAVECDGAAFHILENDRNRDAFMIDRGWTVYRISGADCKRFLKSPWEEIGDLCLSFDDPQAEQLIHRWLHSTVDGLISAIAFKHFATPFVKSEYFRLEALNVLSERRARG